MSDTKERDETAPENLPVAAPGENQPAPEAVVAVPGTGKPNGGGEGGAAVEESDPPVVVKGDGVAVGSESGGSVPMDTTESKVDFDGAAEGEKIGSQVETKVSPADVAGDDKFGTKAAGMVDPDEAVEGKKVDTKPETKVSPAEGGEDNKIGAEVETKIRSVEAAGDGKSGNGSADNGQTKSQPKESSGTESVAVNSIPDKTVGKDVAATAEIVTPVKAVQTASDSVAPGSEMPVQTAEATDDVKTDVFPVSEIKADVDQEMVPADRNEEAVVDAGTAVVKAASGELGNDIKDQVTATGAKLETNEHGMTMSTPVNNGKSLAKVSFLLDDDDDGNDWGTEEEQVAFMKELENFFRSRSMEFKPPKFYGEGLNLLKLWRSVMRLGGYDKVTACKLWRQVGESFRPPKTCTTVSWTFRGFYEKALLDYERHKVNGGEVTLPIASQSEPGIEQSGSGRARRDAAARAMQGWHSQRLLGNGEVSDPVIKDKTPLSLQKREKQLKNTGLLKRKKPSYVDSAVKVPRTQASKTQLDVAVVDLGPPADWVKINVQRTKDCFEIYALVPGLLREEVRVQSDPAGRLVISGEPEHPENPWGVTPFKKVISLSSRIDPHQTSAVVTLHGQLFVRVPFEQSE